MAFKLTLVAAVALLVPGASAETWGERLGYPADARVLILHADDAGMCHEANRAIQRYLVSDVIQSASAMAPCPWFDDFARWAAERDELDVGLHLTLTSEWKTYRWGPLSTGTATLTDSDGYLWPSAEEVAEHVGIQEAIAEMRAQVERARARGLEPSHLDTHMGALYSRPDLAAAYLDLSEELRIPAMTVEMTPRVIEHFRAEGRTLTDGMIERIRAYRLPKLDLLVEVPQADSYEKVREGFKKLVRGLPPGIIEVYFHPSLESDALQRITNSWQQRVWEGQLFADPAVHEFFREEGILFTDWREMMRRFDRP